VAKQLDRGRAGAAAKPRVVEPEAAPAEAPPPPKGGRLKLIIIVAVALLVVAGGGGGAWFFLLSAPSKAGPKELAPTQPYFVDVKPFVVTMKDEEGGMHYVQIALSLKVPGEDAVAAAGSVMPEILDMIRQAVLGFKLDELQTPDGVNKLRAAITTGTNRVLLRSLGGDKIARLGGTAGMLVGNVYFQNLVIE
jgi:flagellar FliL protein